MDDDLPHSPTTSRNYPEEDQTPTSDREIHAFYSYSMAAEVFAVVGVGAFLPVTLEQLARENGVLYSDRTTPCTGTSASASRLLTRAGATRDPDQCLVHILGADVTTASFAMYTFSAAVLCQAVILASFSSFADYGNNRKKLLLTFGTIGALTSMSFIFVTPTIYLFGAILVILGITCLGSSFVILNSFLPLLASNHPSVRNTNEAQSHKRDPDNVELKVSNSISSRAVGLGFAAALFVQILSILVLSSSKKIFGDSISSTLPLRLTLLLAGVWWLLFMIPTYLYLRPRPGPPLANAELQSFERNKLFVLLAYISFAWRSLWRTVTIAARLKQMVIFLAAWFILSDAVASVSGTAILFARTELKFGTIEIALLSITAMLSGVAGASLIPHLSNRLQWSSNKTIIVCLVVMEGIPIYGLLGYLPFVQAWGVGGLQQSWEIYPLAIIDGMVMAGLNSYCRAIYGQLVPPGNEAAFFALFAITDKGSSAIGPAMVGRIVDLTGHIRPAFWLLTVLIAIPIPLIWWVDIDKGKDDARKMARILKNEEGYALRLDNMGEEEETEELMRDDESSTH